MTWVCSTAVYVPGPHYSQLQLWFTCLSFILVDDLLPSMRSILCPSFILVDDLLPSMRSILCPSFILVDDLLPGMRSILCPSFILVDDLLPSMRSILCPSFILVDDLLPSMRSILCPSFVCQAFPSLRLEVTTCLLTAWCSCWRTCRLFLLWMTVPQVTLPVLVGTSPVDPGLLVRPGKPYFFHSLPQYLKLTLTSSTWGSVWLGMVTSLLKWR